MNPAGKTALVTGSGKRLGRQIALTLAESGCNVIVHFNTSKTGAEDVVTRIQHTQARAWIRQFDLMNSQAAGDWFNTLVAEFGAIDILVNSASIFPEDNYQSLTPAALEKSMHIHLLSPLALITGMAAQKREGVVVNILDTRIADADPLHASYHLGKRSLFTVTRDLARTLAPQLRINAVAPGLILPPPGKDARWLEGLKSSNPLNRIGSAKDVADAVRFLVDSDFITGQIIYVDGGRHLKGHSYGL